MTVVGCVRFVTTVGLATPVIAPTAVSGQAPTELLVVATTDVHGRVMHWDYQSDEEAPWGLTRAATVIDSLRRTEDAELILVDAGDFLQGNLFAWYYATDQPSPLHPVVDAYNALAYDAIVPGNHEFDFGVPYLDRALQAAQFYVVSANVYRPDRGGPAFLESAILDRRGVRVGITGLTTPGTVVWNRSRVAGSREVRRMLPAARRVMTDLEARGVDLRIVLIHGGLDPESTYDTTGVGAENDAISLASLPVKPHLVVVGHSHGVVVDSSLNGVHFMQPRPWAQSLVAARVTLVPDDTGRYTVSRIRSEQIPLGLVRPDPEVTRRLAQPHALVRAWGNAVVGTARGSWRAAFARAEDTPIIDFVNEVQRRATGADLSATAAFNPDGGFPDGDIRRRHVFGLYPYENTVTVVRVDGAGLRSYLERSAEYFRQYRAGTGILNPQIPGFNYDMVTGVDYVLDLSQPVGSRVRQLVYRGRHVEPEDTFTLALNHYRQTGSGGFDMIARAPVVEHRDVGVRELLLRELERQPVLDPAQYFRASWRLAPPAAAAAVRVAFGAPALVAAPRPPLRVLSTADLYAAFEPRVTTWSEGRPVGGAVALKAWMDSLAAACHCVTIRVDAGNYLRGSLSSDRAFGAPAVQVFNSIGYDAAAVGVDDFSWGLDTLRRRVGEARYATLAANAWLSQRSGRPDWAREWVMVEREGARVAVVGVTVPANALAVQGSPDEAFRLDDPVDAVNGVLPSIRGADADYIVVVANAEITCTEQSCTGPLVELAQGLDPGGVDLIVGGHTDLEVTHTVNGIPIVVPGSQGLSVGVTDLTTTPDGRREARSTVETVWADAVTGDSSFAELVASFGRTARADREVVATSKFIVSRDTTSESNLGRLVADAYRNATRADLALVSNSALRAGLPAGEVTTADLYAIRPGAHALVILTTPGSVVWEALEHVVAGEEPTANVSGVEVWYDESRPPGTRILRVEFPGGRPLRRDGTYTVGVSNFLAAGLAGFVMLRDLPAEAVGTGDLEALTAYLRRLPQPVEAPTGPRFHPNQ